MSKRMTITLDDDIFEYIDQEASSNRSAFINSALRDFKRRKLEREILRGMQEDDNDPDYLAETLPWETTMADGLEDEAE